MATDSQIVPEHPSNKATASSTSPDSLDEFSCGVFSIAVFANEGTVHGRYWHCKILIGLFKNWILLSLSAIRSQYVFLGRSLIGWRRFCETNEIEAFSQTILLHASIPATWLAERPKPIYNCPGPCLSLPNGGADPVKYRVPSTPIKMHITVDGGRGKATPHIAVSGFIFAQRTGHHVEFFFILFCFINSAL